MSSSLEFTHAIRVNTEKCIGCSHCMKVCPTQAIRIIDGHANISSERCVDCGECFRVCPVNAIYVNSDDLEQIFSFDYRIALIPSVFIGQFPSRYTTSQIMNAVNQLGFHKVFEVEHAVDFIKEIYAEKSFVNNTIKSPMISSYCPAIIRLIQVMFPSMTEHIIRIKAPHDIAALYIREELKDKMPDVENVGVFYVTPCASKIVAAKDPVGEEKSSIDGVVNMNILYNKVYQILVTDESKDECLIKHPDMSPDSVKWSLSGNERKYYTGRSLAIDGMDNVIEFLEKLESGQISDIDFLELRACDQGCAGGILCPENRFLTVERLDSRFDKLNEMPNESGIINNSLVGYRDLLKKQSVTDKIFPRSGMIIDSDMGEALRKIEKLKKIQGYLPGFDCGACGVPTCRALAEDVVKGIGSISQCVFVQRIMEKNYKLSPDQAFHMIERIWGKNRLNKYNDLHGKNES